MTRLQLLTLCLVAACGKEASTPPFVANAAGLDVDNLGTALFQSVDARLVDGNEATLLANGAVFDRLVADINNAQHSVNIVMYIWEAGAASRAVTDALTARARAHVACRVVVDGFGSSSFDDEIGPALRASGCDVRVFRPARASSPLERNHRKIAVIDGRIAYTGGFGIRDNWLGDGVHGEAWRDTSVRFVGPAVADAQQAFAEDWQEAGGALLPASDFPVGSAQGTTKAAFIASIDAPVVTRAERATQLLIDVARKRLWITNAYFVPSRAIIDLLEAKARAGVDVRLLVPGAHDDSKASLVAQRALYGELTSAGIRVWEYQPSMIHAKTMVIDQHVSLVGSINLDPLSLNKLEESALVVEDDAFTEALARAFVADSGHAEPAAAAE